MKTGDRFLQRWRVRKAGTFLPQAARVLDVGCSEGELFEILADRVTSGVGIDPHLERPLERGPVRLLPGAFPADLPSGQGPFDAITMLAVIEHIPQNEHDALAEACADLLGPGGRVIVTAPSPIVDHILDWLMRFHILDGMDTEQHFGFEPHCAIAAFERNGFALEHRARFQMGLNNLFVFRRARDERPRPEASVGATTQ